MTYRSIHVCLSAALALGVLVACDGATISTQDPATAPDRPTNEGVASDGTRVVFAGERRASADTAGSSPSRPDDDGLIREPNEPDPEAGEFTLEEAVVGMPIDGSLVTEIQTELGIVFCDLFADRAPNTVANFIGLVRGARPWWDARAGEWVRRPYYEGLTFHRVIPGFIIQGGDYLGDGSGTVGYTLEDEPHDTLSHDRAGQLAMANHGGPNSAGAQFLITDGAAPQLDEGGYTIFGQCRPAHVVSQIARVPQTGNDENRPLTEVHISRIFVRRVDGGAQAATATVPQLPPGEPESARGASPGPTAGRGRYDPRQYGRPSDMPASGRLGPPSPPRPSRHQGHAH